MSILKRSLHIFREFYSVKNVWFCLSIEIDILKYKVICIHLFQYGKVNNFLTIQLSILWTYCYVPVTSTAKIFNNWIRNLEFNLRLYKKLISILVWWQKTIIMSKHHKLKLSFKKKKKHPEDERYLVNKTTDVPL